MLYEYKLLTFIAYEEREMADVLNDWGSAGWRVLYAHFDGQQQPPWRVMMERKYLVPQPPAIHQPPVRESE